MYDLKRNITFRRQPNANLWPNEYDKVPQKTKNFENYFITLSNVGVELTFLEKT